MFARSIALATGAGLLLGAAPVQDSQTRAAIECKLPRAQMLAVMKGFTVSKVNDTSAAPDRRIVTLYKSPPGVIAYGLPARLAGSADVLNRDDERIMLMARIDAPFGEVRRAALAAHRRTQCNEIDRDEDGEFCGINFLRSGGWEASVTVQEYANDVGISCSYGRAPG